MPELKLPLGTAVTYRGMRGRDEDLLANEKKMRSGEAIDELLANCVQAIGTLDDGVFEVEKGHVQVGDILKLKTPERTALLLAVRQESYGDELPVEIECGCGNKYNVKVNLSELEQVEPPEGYAAGHPVEARLSSGAVVRFDYMDGNRERVLARTADKDKDKLITTSMGLRIVEVEGIARNDVTRWLRELPVRDRLELRQEMAKTDCGPKTDATADCDACGQENTFNVQLQKGFFFPEV
jgi:hypothetical protein